MKVKKIAGVLLSIVAALVILLLCVFLFWLGPTVKLVAEKVGSKALGAPLTIEELSINPRKGTLHLSDFKIANQEAFGRSNVVSLASLDVAIDMGSLFSQTVVVHQVTVNSPYFTYEQSSATDNITEFILNIQEFVGFDPSAPPPPPDLKKLEKERRKKEKKAQKKKEKGPTIVIVESLLINDVQFHLAHTDDDLLDFGMGFEQLSVSMTNGTVQLDNFYVSNPGRLETPNLLSLEQLEILLEPGSIYSSNMIIRAVNIRKPHAFVEYNPDTDTLAEFLKIASGLVAKIPTNTPAASATNEVIIADVETEETPKKEVLLETVTIDDVQFHVINMGDPELSVHLGLEQLAVALDTGDIHLNNLFFTNPTRLDTPNVFSLEGIKVKLTPESLKTDTLVIDDIQVKHPYIFMELNNAANTVGEFMKIANGFIERVPTYPIPEVPRSAPVTEPEPDAKGSPATDSPIAPPFELHNLLVDDIQIKLLDTTPTNNIPDEPHMIAGIGSISVKLVDGQLQIKGITVPNVAGFHATNIFHLANIDIAIQPDSLFSDQVVIDQVFINSPEINLEQTEESGNVAALQAQLMQFVPETSGAANTSVAQPPVDNAEIAETSQPIPWAEQPVILHQLLVTNLTVTLKLPIPTNMPSSGVMGMMGMMDVGNLNPMGKPNPPSGEQSHTNKVDGAQEDPEAPMKLVAFNQMSIEPLKGLLYIDDLRISNPPGFSRHDLVNIEQFRLDLDPDSIQADTLLVKNILISKPRIRFERQIMGDNIKALQVEIQQATIRRGEYTDHEEATNELPEPVADAEEVAEEGQQVIIEHILIAKGMVQAKLSALPSIPVPLPDIELKDIGKEQGGASLAEASTQIFDTLYNQIIGAVSSVTGFAGDALKGAGAFTFGALGSVVDGVAGGLDSAVSGTQAAATDIKEKSKERRSKRRGAGGRRGIFR